MRTITCQAGLVNVNMGNDSARYYTVNVRNSRQHLKVNHQLANT